MIIPTSRQTAWGNNGTFNKRTGAARGAGRQKIKKETSDVSGTDRSGYRSTGGSKRDPRRAVRARPVLGERAFRRGQSHRRAQVVQSRRPERPHCRDSAAPRGRREV